MKNFVIIQGYSSESPVVVMATGICSPQENLDEVANDLRHLQVSGDVVFDLLASNGSRHVRFFVTHFDGRAFSEHPRFTAVEPDSWVREEAAQYLQAHLDEFDLSLLTPATRFAVKKGIAV